MNTKPTPPSNATPSKVAQPSKVPQPSKVAQRSKVTPPRVAPPAKETPTKASEPSKVTQPLFAGDVADATRVPDSFRLAAIDVGSNSVHMVVAQADSDGAVTTLWRVKEMVGLGRISFPSRQLTDEAMDRAVASLARMKQAARQREAEKIVAVATSAIREADNGGDLIERIKRELKLFVRVVSAREEARLIYLGVRGAIDLGRKPALVVDIGGGSVEFIVGNNDTATMLESRKLGAARMTAMFVKSDPIEPKDLAALVAHYDAELDPLCARIEALNPARIIGTSGTLENIAQLCTPSATKGPPGIEIKRLEKLAQRLIPSTTAQRAQLRGLDDQRKDQILAGVLLVRQLMRRLKIDQIELCGAALREGILADYLSRHVPDLEIRRDIPDPRRRSVLDLARRCTWRKEHSRQTARLIVRLFDDLKPVHKLGDRDRELIEYAALLHDIGLHIGRKRHHKHSQYLIEHGELSSFAPEEVQTIAAIARYHRRADPSKQHGLYAGLNPHDQQTVRVGAALLRVADGLDRSHASVITDLRCRLADDQVRIKVATTSDAQLELWGARRGGGLFEKVFKRKLRVED